MKNINVGDANKQPNQYTDYSVDENGHSWISQREIARIINVPKSTFNDWVRRNIGRLNLNEFNQLSPKTLVFVTGYYANINNVSKWKSMFKKMEE